MLQWMENKRAKMEIAKLTDELKSVQLFTELKLMCIGYVFVCPSCNFSLASIFLSRSLTLAAALHYVQWYLAAKMSL